MLEITITSKELKDKKWLISILKDALPNLSEDEQETVCQTILHMKKRTEDSDRRKKHGSRKAN